MNEIYKSFIADVGIKSFYKVGTLCCDTPVALACLTAAAKMTSECEKCGGSYVAGVCTESDRLYYIRA